MKFAKIALAIVLLAIGLMLKPEIVLYLPNGFIPYAILGHPPPAFFYYDAWRDFDNWIKPNDLVVAGGVKCGTNWMLYMSHLIRVKGDIEQFPWDEVMHVTPWPTLRHEPGQSWSEISNKMNSTVLADGKKLKDKWDNQAYPFRVFKSHEVPDDSNAGKWSALPVRRRRDVKFLVTVRSPFDQIRSLYPFFGSHAPEFRRMWGDFPPVYTEKKQVLDDTTDGGPLQHLVWTWVTTWFAYKDDPNVLVFKYEELLKDPRGHVVKLVKFLDMDLTDEQIDKVTHLTSFAEMKKIAHTFDYNIWANNANPEMTVMTRGKLIRAGKKGQGKTFFNEEERLRIQKNVDKNWSPEIKTWMGLE